MLETNICPNCGAVALFTSPNHDIVICQYCKSSFRLALTHTPQPDLGDLILGADFNLLPPMGWQLLNEQAVRQDRHPNGDAEIAGDFQPSEQVHYILHSAGVFDDFDVSATLRFVRGEYKYGRGGIVVRYNSGTGGYVIFVSVQQTYMIGWYEKRENGLSWGGELIDWTTHQALHAGFGESNRLRVVMCGNMMRVYFNGVLASSLRDDRHRVGQIRLGLEPSKHGPLYACFSGLQLREVPPGFKCD